MMGKAALTKFNKVLLGGSELLNIKERGSAPPRQVKKV
jgi:hypothetical protein